MNLQSKGNLLGMAIAAAAAIAVDELMPDMRPKWTYDGWECRAHTKSEARAEFKRILGVDRLPVGAKVDRLP